MLVEKGLIIREPWISHILGGRKVWEMRPGPTSFRGWVGLIRQGSGEVAGVARVIDSLGPFTRGDYLSYQHRHAIPHDMLEEALANNWVHAWVLTDVGTLATPVPYDHPSGAVTFVNFADETRKRLADLVFGREAVPPSLVPIAARAPSHESAPAPAAAKEEPEEAVYEFRPQKARARGRPADDGFLVLAGSTAMLEGSPAKKRDREERDRLIRIGVLVPHADPDLLVFSRDHLCSSASQAAGIVKDGNSSGPQQWLDPTTGRSLREQRWANATSITLDVPRIGVFVPPMSDSKRHHVISRGQKPKLYRLSELADRGEGRTPWVKAFEEILLGLYWSIGEPVPYAFRTPDGLIRSLDAGCIKMMLNREPADIEVWTDPQGFIQSVAPTGELEDRYGGRREELTNRVQAATAFD